MAEQVAFAGGKCTQFGCHCAIYQESSSKWSKGKCQTCNHTQIQHKNVHHINNTLQKKENISTNWTCKSCTFSNEIKSSKCSMCHTPNPNQQNNNSSIYVKCTECESRVLITEYESHLLMHQLSNKQNKDLVYLQCTECNKQILAMEFDSHLLIHQLTKQQSQSDQSATIPCDQCNEQILITQYDLHRASHNNNKKELVYIKCTESSCNQQILASELDSHLLIHQLSKPSKPELIPCEYDRCNLKIAAKEYTAHIAEHKNNENKLVYITCTESSCKQKQILASEYDSHLLLHKLSEPAKPSQPQIVLIPCEYTSCNLKIPSNEYESHINAHKVDLENKKQQKDDEVCYIMCDFPSCDYKVPFDKYQQHRSSHDNILIKCDYPSCNQQIPFQQYQTHQKIHREEEEKTTCIECDYKGCGKLIPIKEYQSHQASHNNQQIQETNANLHQQLAAMTDLQQQLEAKKANVTQEAQQLKDKLKHYEEQKENKPNDWLQNKEKEAMQTGKMICCKLKQKRNLDEDSADSHFRRCESQFMRSCRNMGASAVGNGFNKTISEVEYIINPTLIKKFETKKKALMAKNNCDESKLNIILAWHGTKSANLDNIVSNNFNLAKLGSNTGDKGYYGCGIYFSEFANISQGYGDGLLLCKIMLGKQYSMNSSNVQTGRAVEPGYDSHVVGNNNQNNQYGQEVVIFDVDQILPCYIVRY